MPTSRRGLASLLLVLASSCTFAVTSHAPPGEREEHEHPGGVMQRAQMRRSPDGTVPHDALMTAWAQRERMVAIDTLGAPVQWNWLGPGNVGGRIRAILTHPTNPQRLWIGAAGGGVWRTDDGGASWQRMTSMLSMFGCGCMLLDPSNPDHLWFGSGEGYFDALEGSSNTAILRGAGLFESFDAGATWARIASTATPEWYFVNRLAVDPNDARVLLAATGSGIWRSTDAGQTWSRRTTTRTLDVDFHPTDSLRAVAGRTDGRAEYSIDGGLSWTANLVATGATRVETAYARSNPLLVYAAVADTNWQVRVYRSPDGGQTWALRSSATIATYSLYNILLWVDPTNADNLLLGGVQLYRSTDGGVSRTQSTNGAHPDYHVAVEAIGFDGTTNRRVYVGDDGGIHTRPDWSTGTWQALNNQLGITQFYGAAMNPTTGVMVAGAQDNGTSRYTGNPNGWVYNVIGGDGGFCAADPTNANYFYGGYQYFGAQRSSNGGVSWGDIRGATTSDVGFNFMPYFLLDPNDSNRMVACGRALWRANNVRNGSPPTWTQIKPGRSCAAFAPQGPANAHFQDNPVCNHSTAQIAAGNSDVVWVGHNDGEIWRTSNGTAATPTWTLVDSQAGQLPDRWVSSITIDPADHRHVLVSLMGYASDNLWETRDDGQTWQQRTGSGTGALPALPISWVLMHPRVAGCLFVATDLGLFCSTDAGTSWGPVAGGPENVCIDQLVWKNDRELLCVTHGLGIWQATLPLASTQPVGTGCANGTPATLTASPPVLGATATFALANGRPNALVFFGYSFGPPASLPIGACTVVIDLPRSAPYVAGATDAAGVWSHGVAIPAAAALLGSELVAQCFLVGPGGPLLGAGDLSTGLQFTVGL